MFRQNLLTLSSYSDSSTRIFGASGDTSSGDEDTLSDGTIKHPKLTINQLGLVGEDGHGGIIEISNFEVAYTNTEPKENIEFNKKRFYNRKT